MTIVNSFYAVNMTLILRQAKNVLKRENYNSTSLIHVATKILNQEAECDTISLLYITNKWNSRMN